MRRALTPLARRALAAHAAPGLARHLSMSSPELFAKASRRLERVPPACVVVSPWDNPALARAPADAAELLIGNTLDELLAHGDEKLRAAECLLWVPPGDAGVLYRVVEPGAGDAEAGVFDPPAAFKTFPFVSVRFSVYGTDGTLVDSTEARGKASWDYQVSSGATAAAFIRSRTCAAKGHPRD